MRTFSTRGYGLSRWALCAAVSLVALVGAGPAGAEILYDQYNNPGPFASSSQNYETSQNAFDTELADDFVVGVSNGWLVNQIEIDGQYFNGPGPASSFNVRFYADAGGLPGTEVAARTNVAFTPGPAAGDVVIALTPGYPTRRWDLLALGAGESELHSLPVSGVGRTEPFSRTWAPRGATRATGCRRPAARPGVAARRRATSIRASPDQVFRLSGNIGAGGPAAHSRPDDDHRRGRATASSSPARRSGSTSGSGTPGGETATGVSSVLSAQSAGVTITQPNSAYAERPVRGNGDEHDSLHGRGRRRGHLRNQPELAAQLDDRAGHVPDRPRSCRWRAATTTSRPRPDRRSSRARRTSETAAMMS